MKQPKFITFTGIDDRTNLQEASAIARDYPIEWGVLFSSSNRDARYCSAQTVKEVLEIDGKKAAHLCGQFSKDIQHGLIVEEVILGSFDRIQVNGDVVITKQLELVEDRLAAQIILQTRGAFDRSRGFLELFDPSGGRGEEPSLVPSLTGNICGFAGGIGPDTVKNYLSKIEGEGKFWIDMESNIRTDGWFDLEKVLQVCQTVYGR